MPRIEFYVLPDSDPYGRLLAACRLAAKAWQHDLPTFIRCADDAQQSAIDELLWRFRPERFLPHALASDAETAPIQLGLDDTKPPASTAQGVLINLCSTPSLHLQHFARVIEIVNQEPQQLATSRDNFRRYRQQGYDPQRVEL